MSEAVVTVSAGSRLTCRGLWCREPSSGGPLCRVYRVGAGGGLL